MTPEEFMKQTVFASDGEEDNKRQTLRFHKHAAAKSVQPRQSSQDQVVFLTPV
ncbi:MAG: hypothetical protein AAF478_13065 [Pseudomonadota bacterium]